MFHTLCIVGVIGVAAWWLITKLATPRIREHAFPSVRVFFVTGAASGIGRAVVQELISRGQRVYATDINTALLEKHFETGSDLALAKLDVSHAGDWRRCMEECIGLFGSVDVMLNIAGYLSPCYTTDMHFMQDSSADKDIATLHRHFDINTKGVILGSQCALDQMQTQAPRAEYGGARGHIVNIGSLSCFSPVKGLALYAASKAAVRSYTLTLYLEAKEKGVAVSLICPDGVLSPMTRDVAENSAAALIWTCVMYTPEEVAKHILYGSLSTQEPELWLPPHRVWAAKVFDNIYHLSIVQWGVRWMSGLAAKKQQSQADEFKKIQ